MTSFFKGIFQTPENEIKQKLSAVKAFVFDWDGVFNDGRKDHGGSSVFSEVDAMGTNLLRYNHYIRNGQVPVTAIITGEHNHAGFALAKREHFNAVYFKVKYKITALEHLCKTHHLQPHEVCFFFDDVLDFSASKAAGLRIMLARPSTPLLTKYAIDNGLVDYATAYSGGEHGLREGIEMLMGISGEYNTTVSRRADYDQQYTTYLAARNEAVTDFYSTDALEKVHVE